MSDTEYHKQCPSVSPPSESAKMCVLVLMYKLPKFIEARLKILKERSRLLGGLEISFVILGPMS